MPKEVKAKGQRLPRQNDDSPFSAYEGEFKLRPVEKEETKIEISDVIEDMEAMEYTKAEVDLEVDLPDAKLDDQALDKLLNEDDDDSDSIPLTPSPEPELDPAFVVLNTYFAFLD